MLNVAEWAKPPSLELCPSGKDDQTETLMRKPTGKFSGSNHKTAAAWNRGLAIQLLRRHGTLSRNDISRMTQLQGSTLSYIVRELLDKNIVRVVGKRQSKVVGQKQVLLTLNPDLGWMLGVALRPGTATLVLLDAAGRRIDGMQMPVLSPLEALPEQLHAAVTQWLDQRGTPGGKMLGLGVGVPGVVDADAGVVLRSIPLSAVSVPLRKLLFDRFNVTTVIDHDACFGATAEATDGAAADVSHFVYFAVNTTAAGPGVTRLSAYGSALYLQDKIYRGAFYGAGELTDGLEPMPIDLIEADMAALADADGPMPPALVQLAAHLGRAIGPIINLVDAQKVVLAGTARIANLRFIEEVQAAVTSRLIAIPGRAVAVVKSGWEAEAAARGAAISTFDALVAGGTLMETQPADAVQAGG